MFNRYYKIAGIIIRILYDDRYIIEETVPFNRFLTSINKNNYQINLYLKKELSNYCDNLIYQDSNNLVYGKNKKIRYLGNYSKGSSRKKCLIKELTKNESNLEIKHSDFLLSEQELFNCLGLDSILAEFGRLIIHAAFICYQNKGIIFTAPSQTGKSTQAALWKKYCQEVEIINGDRAIIGIEMDKVKVYSLPFCGSSGIALNIECDLKAIVVLRQGKKNRISRITGKEAYQYLYSQINSINWHYENQINILNLLGKIIELIPIYYYECLPEQSAVIALKKIIDKEGD